MDPMQIEKLNSCGIDYVAGVDRFGGNEAMFEKFIRRYTEDTHYEELLTAIEANDSDQAFRIAHTLKGVVGNLSFTTYYNAITPLTELLKEGKLEEARALVPSIQQAEEKALEALKDL